jgi:hypothetical protein
MRGLAVRLRLAAWYSNPLSISTELQLAFSFVPGITALPILAAADILKYFESLRDQALGDHQRSRRVLEAGRHFGEIRKGFSGRGRLA